MDFETRKSVMARTLQEIDILIADAKKKKKPKKKEVTIEDDDTEHEEEKIVINTRKYEAMKAGAFIASNNDQPTCNCKGKHTNKCILEDVKNGYALYQQIAKPTNVLTGV